MYDRAISIRYLLQKWCALLSRPVNSGCKAISILGNEGDFPEMLSNISGSRLKMKVTYLYNRTVADRIFACGRKSKNEADRMYGDLIFWGE